VSLWRRLVDKLGGRAAERGAEVAVVERAASGGSSPAARGGQGGAEGATPLGEAPSLRDVGTPAGPTVEVALALVRGARGTSREGRVLDELSAAIAAREVAEPLRVACAELASQRGDDAAAIRALAGSTGAPALVLLADLFAATGEDARALATLERVLARDLDAPGARERHARLRARMGGAAARVRSDEATVVVDTPASAYRLVRELARGGAGTVYEAEDARLARRVAFKVYHRRELDRRMLEREVQSATRFAGPHVVRVFDASLDEGWLALEWCSRGSLRDVLRRGEHASLLPARPWALELAEALARVHAAGEVHADVKPANVLLRDGGGALLGDFGLTVAVGSKSEPGSAGYVPPERLAGRPADPRDDVYGFGRVLEDVLVHAPGREPELERLAQRCVGELALRPSDGAELARAVVGA
jgi:tRNA A-37 threonylcarbamoyl transferase component Bud32